MALPDPPLDAVNSTTLKSIWPRTVFDQFFLDTPFAAYLRAKCLAPFGGGAFIQNTHLVRPLIGGFYDPMGDNANITKRDTLTVTAFNMKYLKISVPEFLSQILVDNVGPEAVFSLIAIDMQNAMMTGSGITAVGLSNHGQASGGGVVGNRPKAIDGWPSALNDGITPGYDGSVFINYANSPRNGFSGSALNSVPYFGGNPATGATAPIEYDSIEMLYQTARKGNKEPDLIVCNKALYAGVKMRIQPQQRFAQERDPYWGASGLKINNAMFLADEYFPSLKFGKNDPDLGNYLTSTFVSPGTVGDGSGGTADPRSNLPIAGVTVTAGEVLCMFHMDDFLFRIADNPVYGWGNGGFVPAPDNDRVVAAIRAAQQLQCTSPRTQIQSYGWRN
jgi:hypothetical protein